MAPLKDPRALFLAVIVVTAMAMSSCHAAQGAEECNRILPCTDSTCYFHCQKLGYKDPKTRCERSPPTKGQFYDTCCCLKPEMDDNGLPSE
uniref:Uncharacterized protein n=1 Tax=Aegilops tauschii subsp. strangulata TaxID=200361 RepID=A0A452ZX86_AEGTS